MHINCDAIMTVEATPDTVLTLNTGAKIVVCETPAEVAAAVRDFRAAILVASWTLLPEVPASPAEFPRGP